MMSNVRRITFAEDRMHGCRCRRTHNVSNPRCCNSVLAGARHMTNSMPEPILHNVLAFGQVGGVAGRRDFDYGTLKKASVKRDRRKTKRSTTTTTAGGKTVNKSCDTCSIKKRRCDGGRPCSRCVSRGDGHKCTYSTRRPYTSRNRRARLWSSSTSSPWKATVEVASTTSRTLRCKCSIDSDCSDGGDQQNTSRVVEALSPDGPTETPESKCSSAAINEVEADLALAQQGVMSLIVTVDSSPLQASDNGPYQQTMMKQHPVPCCHLDEACDIGVGYAEMMLRTMSLDGQKNKKNGDIPGLEVDCPVLAYSVALVKDNSTDEDDDSSTLDLDVNILPSSSSDGTTVVHVQHLPPTGENKIADVTVDETAATLGKTISALGQGEREIISAEDWFEFAATL